MWWQRTSGLYDFDALLDNHLRVLFVPEATAEVGVAVVVEAAARLVAVAMAAVNASAGGGGRGGAGGERARRRTEAAPRSMGGW